ncbi:MAG TPA: C39 family peptidase [Pirellulales bacterium]|jgi:hypothetical protein|nr:C39 family peptidase [Pirellulales bacterium]
MKRPLTKTMSIEPSRIWLLAVVCAALLAVAHCLLALSHAQELTAPVRDPSQIIQKRPMSWKQIHNRNIVMQNQDYSCGAAALATVMRYFWQDPISETDVMDVIDTLLTTEEFKDRVENGLSMADLRRAAVKMGYQAQVGKVQLNDLVTSKIPLIVALKADGYDHFVVVRGIYDGRVYLADPIRGNIRVNVPLFRCQWQKNAALVVLKPGLQPPICSCLSIECREFELGWLNSKIIQMTPPRQSGSLAP